MRLRNVKGSREAIASSEFTINEPEKYKGCWHTVFGNDKPIYIEDKLSIREASKYL